MKEKTSRFTRSELEYFFEYKEGLAGGVGYIILMNHLMKNREIREVRVLIDSIQEIDEIHMLAYVVKIVIQQNNNKPIKDMCNWDETKDSTLKMIDLIENNFIDNEEYKEKIIECLKNPSETKERFLLMLKQFYDKSYSSIEDEIIQKLKSISVKYDELFNKNPLKFSRQFLKANLDKLNISQNVHVSYFKYVGAENWISGSTDEGFGVLGAYSDMYYGDEQEKEIVQMFFKVLSDKKRLDIIHLLSDRPCYVYELAEKLGMSAATISYHLNQLQGLDIVQYERYDHRIYYSLDKDRLRELSEKSLKNLLHE